MTNSFSLSMVATWYFIDILQSISGGKTHLMKTLILLIMVFVSTFKNSFVKKLKELEKKLKLKNHVTMVGKDCPRQKIWRMSDFDVIKETATRMSSKDRSSKWLTTNSSKKQELILY